MKHTFQLAVEVLLKQVRSQFNEKNITHRLTKRCPSSTSNMLSLDENLVQNVSLTGTRFLAVFVPRISKTTFQQLSSKVRGSGTACGMMCHVDDDAQ